MHRSFRALLVTTLAVALIVPSLALSQTFGRLQLTVLTPDGAPAKGVQAVATCDLLTNFRQEKKTDKKGRMIFTFLDGTKTYALRIEHEGFEPLDLPFKPEIGGTATREITLTPLGQAAKGNLSAEPPSLTAAQRLFNEGLEALQADDRETATAKFLESLEKDDTMAFTYSALAGIYAEAERYEDALAMAQKLIELEPENPRGHRIAYEAYDAAGNEKEAKKSLAALSRLDTSGDTVALVFNEGVQAFRVNDYATAKERFEEALRLDPTLKEPVSALALLYAREGNYTEAAAMSERALEIDPNDQRSLKVRWESYKNLGDEAKAAEALKALGASDPNTLGDQLFKEGVALFDGGDLSNAVSRFEQALTLVPDHARAHYRLGLAKAGSDPAAAKEHFQKFLDLAPENDPERATAQEMMSYLN